MEVPSVTILNLLQGTEENHDRDSNRTLLERVKSVTVRPNGSVTRFEPREGQVISTLFTQCRQALGPTQPRTRIDTGGSFRGMDAAEAKTWDITPRSPLKVETNILRP
jgi:hypothetical protein